MGTKLRATSLPAGVYPIKEGHVVKLGQVRNEI